jgi:precorrin-2 methylase
MTPLQKTDSVESSSPTGFSPFPWDYDMDDELLKLLITKARRFEAQIRYASNDPLVAIETNRGIVQLTKPYARMGSVYGAIQMHSNYFKDNIIHDTHITTCNFF